MTEKFINVSNHPSSAWAQEQLEVAKQYGEISDIQFPNVLPTWGHPEMCLIAQSLIEEIIYRASEECDNSFRNFEEIENYKGSVSFPNVTVHIMGEMTLTYMVINYLKKFGFNCIASTTERKVIMNPDGSKTAQFTFVRFRDYISL